MADQREAQQIRMREPDRPVLSGEILKEFDLIKKKKGINADQ